ncbi:MAG: NAD(P)/FAD-dependent oxidoreductase, partial [Caldisericota bacterium]|nr:NAD(P)/FAD-dependent oxidoreductase [Caldisericota bacterium]
MKNYSVIIIGGGPAGATVGQYLKEKNIDYLIIEKGGSYRDKVCAGGIPPGIMDILPNNLKDFEKTEYDTLSIDFKDKLSSTVKLNKPFLHGVERTKFDHHLRKGLNVHYNEKFIGFNNEKNNISVHTDKTTYTTKFLIGADGVGSKVSILSGLARKKRFILGEEKEVFQKNIIKPNTAKLFLGYNYLGYGWMLPKQNHYSAGSGALQKYFLSSSKGTVEKFDKGKGETKIYPISLWGGEEPLTSGRIALAGEAGNLVDPFTAAGIYPALLSGKLLAVVIENALKNGKNNLQKYNKLVI